MKFLVSWMISACSWTTSNYLSIFRWTRTAIFDPARGTLQGKSQVSDYCLHDELPRLTNAFIFRQVDQQLHEIEIGSSKEYLGPLQELADRMNSRKEVADILKKLRIENICHKFQSEEQAARQHYESEKQLAVDRLNDELLEKIRRLEEDSHNVDISWTNWESNTRSNKVRGPGRKKPVTVTGPYIVYMLRDDEIMEDWTLIKKSIKAGRPPQQQQQRANLTLAHAWATSNW